MALAKAVSATRIFNGEIWLRDHAILSEGDRITAVEPISSLPDSIKIEHFGGSLVPAFIDLQIYGAYEKLLAVYPEADSLFKLNEYCRKGGAVYCLPTVATNAYKVFHQSIDAIRDYWNQGGEGVLGIHLEGPWINPVKRGAHIESLIHSPTVQQVKDLLEYGKGVIKMITLAPEVCSQQVIDLILSYNVVISAGHSNASYEQAIHSFENGITTVTHLYNAMSPLQHRSPGLVGAAMDHGKVMSSIIPDGHHVDYAAIRIAKEVMKERLFFITDAVTTTDKGGYQHYLAGDKYEAGGILSGSALTMVKAIQNLVNHAGIELNEALKMCSLYPAKVMGLDKELGKIEKGYRAKMVLLNQENDVVQLID
ncbi:N-acetylglucosamine-6-phosphate deacetylase [Terrimonas pollutisoli]|uniref:N-acetylglucosamine-6-phosphate deacetylase n=1 Tax=Terrimonas pollutisoli TaxID=3034147 RepID=UPI0023EAA565|nr:N-acetylglucosamine-6-phosphate deacetylase [Terrimonas sp. H1YJ31]